MVAHDAGSAIAIFTVGFFLIQGLWLAVLTYFMFKRSLHRAEALHEAQAQAFSSGSENAVLEDLFLLDRGGLLMRHLTRRMKPHVDPDILTGMFRAVQEFVREAFRGGEGEEKGDLHELAFGELKISLISGKHVVLASVVRGERTEDLKGEMMAAIRDLEWKNGDRLKDWDGHMSEIGFVDDYLTRLLDGAYQSEALKRGDEHGVSRVRQGEVAASE